MKRRIQAGLTLLEIMLSSAILVVMMSLAWRTISTTSNAKKTFEAFEERNHELRLAMKRICDDFEASYLSKNEDQTQSHPRTLFQAKAGRFPTILFSTMGHRVLWGDANESEQTVISYVTRNSPTHSGKTDLIRREQRRLSNDPPEDEPAEYDILLTDIESLKLEYFNWKNVEWQDTWDTTQSDGQKGILPYRVRITITTKDAQGQDYKVVSEARILMQEPLNFVQ
ncbi:MAG TPA: type II secretion system protein GspJ [Kofleriaceae bacterium]